jgi:hypothetical protein
VQRSGLAAPDGDDPARSRNIDVKAEAGHAGPARTGSAVDALRIDAVPAEATRRPASGPGATRPQTEAA